MISADARNRTVVHGDSVHFFHSISRILPVEPLPTIAKFDNKDDFEGWNCGKITTCGKFGNVCGGPKTKAAKHDIKKTFAVPAGKYLVALDFIKIDSWFVRAGHPCRVRRWVGGARSLCRLG